MRSDTTTSQGEQEANERQEVEAACQEAAACGEWRNKSQPYNQPGLMRGRCKGECDTMAGQQGQGTGKAATVTARGRWRSNEARLRRKITHAF